MFNSFGNILRLTSFGESHGKGIGGVIDGFPAGITIDMDFVQSELDRRRPGQSRITTSRKESDKVEFLSGIFEGKSTGCPIGFIVWNENQHSNDYNNLKEVYRPSHADYTYNVKYGIRDHRGGGRSSARETISRVVAGALAKLALKQLGIRITAYTSQVGPIKLEENSYLTIPILADYRISKRWIVSAGPYFSYLLEGNFSGHVYEGHLRTPDQTGSKVEFTGESIATYDFSNELRKFQWGIQFGGEWKAFKHLTVHADVTWGLNNIFQKDFDTITFNMYPIYLNLGFGYAF